MSVGLLDRGAQRAGGTRRGARVVAGSGVGSVAVVVNVKRPQTSDEFVGAVPSVVQRIVAPLVGVTRLTMTEPVKIPGVGLRSGAAIFWTGSYDADATALGAIPLLKARALTVVDQLKITGPL